MSVVLAGRLWPQSQSNSIVRNCILALAASLFVAVAAQITIPATPVPFTLQTFAVLAVGAAYGASLGAATMVLYAVLGAFLPVFLSGSSGWFDDKLGYFLPASTMGYVFGFVIAVWLVGRIVGCQFSSAFARSVIATLAGAALIYVPGVAWLAAWTSITGVVPEGSTAMSAALTWGLYPFLLWDVVKALLAGVLVPAVTLALKT
jgi:biotin transport system substrate-specific component